MKTPHKMKTLSECMIKLQNDGFKENFLVQEGKLVAPEAKKDYAPEDIKIVNFYRFEGISDPGDNSILYAIETNDGIKGVLTDAYGSYADDNTTEYVKKVEEITKKANPDLKT